MIIVGSNLKELIHQYNICGENDFDETCISLRLGKSIFKPLPNYNKEIIYGVSNCEPLFEQKSITDQLVLQPSEQVLACSDSKIIIPNGYIGFVHTKGTLARLFVTAICCDSQIDPGFAGKITFELINLSPFIIHIPVSSPIANLYIEKCSTTSKVYNGKYLNSDIPTIPKFR